MTADAAPRTLDPRVVRLWWWTALLLAAGAAGAAALLALALGAGALPATLVGAGGVAAAAVLAHVWPPVRYRHWVYQVRAADVMVCRGVFWRTISVVPHARIQHVDTRRGPLERGLGLARVIIYTAGNRGGAVVIPGLAVEDAAALRDRLAALGGDDAV